MTHLYLMRGVPGSGKSTFGNILFESGVVQYVFSADDWMVDFDGNYLFRPEKLKDCHSKCLRAVGQALCSGKSVAVCNTFVRLWEMDKYLALGFPTTIIRCEGDYGNIHGVPESKVSQMKKNFEAL